MFSFFLRFFFYDFFLWIYTLFPFHCFSSPLQDSRSRSHQPSHSSLPRNTRITVPPDISSPTLSPYHPQPIISRISIPPASAQTRQRRPIPLSVIMRLQNPHWSVAQTCHPRALGGADMPPYHPAAPLPREYLHQPVLQPQPPPPELRQPAVYSEGKQTPHTREGLRIFGS